MPVALERRLLKSPELLRGFLLELKEIMGSASEASPQSRLSVIE
jgi:hypothetical protein